MNINTIQAISSVSLIKITTKMGKEIYENET